MSWTTGTQTEALSCANVNGTALASSTTATQISPTEGAAYTPANFWLPTYGASKGLLVKAWGVLGTTGTPNLTMEVLANTTQGTRNASGILATTGAVAGPSGATNIPWELEVEVSVVTTGAAGTALSMGFFKMYPTVTTIQAERISSSAANPNTSMTLNTQSAYYIELFGTWGTSSASNTIQVYGYTVLGLN